MLVKNYVKKATIALMAGLAGMSLFACSSSTKKEVTRIENVDPYKQESVDMGDSIVNKEIEETIKGSNNENDEESLRGKKIDWAATPGREYGGKTGSYMIATLEDEKYWEIGPKGYPEPPKEFKTGTKMTLKPGAVDTPEAAAQRERMNKSWDVFFKINGKYYYVNGTELPGRGRTISIVQDPSNPHDNPRVIMKVSANNHESINQLLGYLAVNDAVVNDITGGKTIKQEVGSGK